MVTLKIECTCGQKYQFETEPANGRMPWAVVCPVCNADGTEAANGALAQSFPAPTVAVTAPAAPSIARSAPASPGGLRISRHSSHAEPAAAPTAAPASAPAASRRPPARVPGAMEANQARHEARAKVLWGDPPEQVLSWLLIQGFSRPDAQALVNELFNERAKTVRSGGFRNIGMGVALLCVPGATVLYMLYLGVIQTTLLGLSSMAGLFGLYLIIKGIIKVVAPKSLTGDAME